MFAEYFQTPLIVFGIIAAVICIFCAGYANGDEAKKEGFERGWVAGIDYEKQRHEEPQS